MSFSVDIEGIFSYASQVVTWLMPIIAISAGLALGFMLLKKITGIFRSGF